MSKIPSRKRKVIAKKLISLYGDTCYYCHCELRNDIRTIEHLVPRSLGGTNVFRNLRLACEYCNKLHMNPLETKRRPKKLPTKLWFYWSKQRTGEKTERLSWVAPCIPIA